MVAVTRPARFFRIGVLAVLFALAAVVFGAYARLSEAGLGCPDGPACSARPWAPAALQATVDQRPAQRSAWKDMVARYIAGAQGLFLIQLAVLGWQLRHRPGQQVVIPVATLLLVFVLTAVAVFTIDLHAKPVVMTIQYLGSLLVLLLLWWVTLRQQRLFRSVAASPLTRSLRPRVLAALGLTLLAVLLGAWSMVNYAAPACPDFPMCQGEYWPSMDIGAGLMRWSAEGLGFDRTELDMAAAVGIQFAHRLAAFAAVLYVGWLALHLLRVGMQEAICRYGLLLLVMLSFNTAFGIMQAVGGMPLTVGVAHSATSALLLLTLVTLYHVVRTPPAK
jgi:heme a synthase